MSKLGKLKFFSHLKWWLGAALVTIFICWFAQQVILKPVLEAVATKAIGARVTLGSFSLNILTHRIRITDLHIYNEQGFPPGVFCDAPEILVDIDLFNALRGKLHFPLIVFRLNKMVVFKDPQGKLNINELKIVKEKAHEKTKGPTPNFSIDELKLNIGQVVVEDDSTTPALIEAYDLNLKDATFHNINGVPKLVGLVMFEALKPTAMQSAGLYAATTLLGIGFLPGLAIGVAIASDDAIAEINHSFGQVFTQSVQLFQHLGQIKRTDDRAGQIFAKVYNCDISVTIQDEGWGHSRIIIKARKYFLARPEIAGGLLYQLKEELK